MCLIAMYRVLEYKQFQILRFIQAVDANSVVVRLSSSGEIKEANSAFCQLMGISETLITGLEHRYFVPDRVSESASYSLFWDMLREGVPHQGTYERVTTAGDSVWVAGSYMPLRSKDGSVYEVIKVATDVTKQIQLQIELQTKNAYLEHAAKILRHDMHSGINTYMPRGITSLERRLSECGCAAKVEMPLKLIKEGLGHTQKVYEGVREFTNLVRPDASLKMRDVEIKPLIEEYLDSTAYRRQVVISEFPKSLMVNGPLFCTAIDNLIRNGLKYNDAHTKLVRIHPIGDNTIAIVDNGRGMTQREFEQYSKPYVRRQGQIEAGSGLGLNICIAILREHKFSVTCEKLDVGTLIRIGI
jgi:PAS domain S-box-containing protein